MRKVILFLILFFVLSFCFSQERFFNLYPGWTLNVAEEKPDGFLIMGEDTIDSGYSNTPIFNEIDIYGNLINTKRYVNDTVDGITSYSRTSYLLDENYLVCAIYKLYNKGYSLFPIIIFLNRLDLSIDSIINLKNYFDERSTRILSVIESGDQILLIGDSQYTQNYNTRSYFGSFNLVSGTFEYKDYIRPNNCIMTPYQIFPTSDNGYILACEQDITGELPEKVYACLLKIDSVGNEKWRYVIPGKTGQLPYPNFEAATYRPRVFNSPDGNYFVVWTDPQLITYNYLTDNPNSTIRIAKLIDNGDSGTLIEEKDLKSDFDNPVLNWYLLQDSFQDSLGNIYLLLQNYWGSSSFLAKIHANGTGAWLRRYQCFPEDDALSYTQLIGLNKTSDGGFMLTGGYVNMGGTMFPNGMYSSIVFKVDSCGCFDTEGCNAHCADSYAEYFVNMAEASIFPNPARDKITVGFDYGGGETEFSYKIYSINGQLLAEGKSEKTAQTFDVEVDELPSGYYTIQFWGGGKIFTGKFVKV